MTHGDDIREQDRLFDILLGYAYDKDGWILPPGAVPLESKQAAQDFATCIAGTENDHAHALAGC